MLDPLGVDICLRKLWAVIPDPDACEYVRAPLLQLNSYRENGNRFIGDCDDAATLAAALVKAQGYPCMFIATRRAGAREYSHVFLRVYAGGAALDIDPVTPETLLPLQDHVEEMVVML